MADAIRSFELRTPDRALQTVTGRLRDAVLAVQRSLSMSTAVVSAYSAYSPPLPLVQGYMDHAGKIKIHRNLDSDTGTEFENWSDARRHGDGLLPGGGWRINWFVHEKAPSGLAGEAVLAVEPHELSQIDFARESGGRQLHHGRFIVTALPIKLQGWPGWTANHFIEDADGRKIGPLAIHASYDSVERAVDSALSQAESLIDGGITLPETSPPAEI
jgi:hypothetical protein